MMPKRAVADRATMTRLCARLRRRLSSFIVLVLRLHRGLRREGHAVAGSVAHNRDPWLEEEGDLDRDRMRRPRRLPDARAVPDEPAVGLGRRRRRGAWWRDQAWIGVQGETTAQLALDRRDDRGIAWQWAVVWHAGASALASGIGDGVIGIDGPAEVDGPEQQQEEDRCQNGKLDHRLSCSETEES